ncbi:MAG TPA: hypothetical protein VFS30_04755 [Dehalococcoidia bacterium]|nr:hypothetical protein [Dehalococcoidia bacterium]
MRITYVAAIVSCSALLCVAACGSPNEGHEASEIEQIRFVLSRFYEEAYNPGGDLEAAYVLFDSTTQSSCPFSKFKELATFAREFVGSRRLVLEALHALNISDTAASVVVELDGGGLTASFLPEEVTLRKEQGNWRYVVTTDPTCESLFEFFDLDPGVEATTEAQADPNCEFSYPEFCIPPPPPDLDCADLVEESFIASPPDPHAFDTDGDGFGCEENQPPDR